MIRLNNDSTKPKPKPNVSFYLSIVFGGLALAALIASVVLIVLIRNTSFQTVDTSTVISITQAPVTYQTIKMQAFNAVGDTFTLNSGLGPLVSAVVSVGINSYVTNTVQPYENGMIPFSQTIGLPLQIAAEGFGWCAMTPEASQVFTSLPNGLSAVGQYFYSTKDNSSGFVPNTDGYPNGNRIFYNCPDSSSSSSSTGPQINTSASAIGSVGYNPIAISFNSQRLYVSYRQPNMGSSPDSLQFPFAQLAGNIAVFTRPAAVSGFPSAVDWTYNCGLGLKNPFGSQVGGIATVTNPVTGLQMISDDFGQIIRVSVNLTNGNSMVASRGNFGYIKREGAVIAIYEESVDQNSGQSQNTVSGVLQLTSGTTSEKLSFGSAFDIGNDWYLPQCNHLLK